MKRAVTRRVVGPATSVILVVALVAGCSDQATEPTTTEPTTATTTTTTTTAPTTTVADTTTTTAPTTTAPDTSGPTTTVAIPTCDPNELLRAADDAIAQARLAPGSPWDVDAPAPAFGDRTHSGAHVRDQLALDCEFRAVSQGPGGAERLLVGAWTDARSGFVIQLTDTPTEPYRHDARLQLWIDEPLGEWLIPQRRWAGTIADGSTVVIDSHDLPFAHVAKSWFAGFEGWEDLPVTIEAERYAIDALEAAGARNISVADPARTGSQVAQIQFSTHRGLHSIAVVAPLGQEWFDPMEPMIEGDTTIETIRGVDVRITIGVPESYALATVGWTCDGMTWWFDVLYGTVDEYRELVERLLEATGC